MTAVLNSTGEMAMTMMVPAPDALRVDAPLVRSALAQAQIEARDAQRVILASVILPAPARDALAIFRAAGAQGAWWWEHPERGNAFVGVGNTLTVSRSPDFSISAYAQVWRDRLPATLVIHAPAVTLTPPLAFGGFAFDPTASPSGLWDAFGAGLLTVPDALYYRFVDHAALALNALVSVDSDGSVIADRLIALAERLMAPTTSLAASEASHAFTWRDLRPATEWQGAVARATDMMRRGAVQKVVLARGVTAQAAQPVDLDARLARLRAQNPRATCFAVRRGASVFVGATPELLARVEQGHVQTMALAGTAPRGGDPATDAALGEELLASLKNHAEHAIVAQTIRAALEPLCAEIVSDAEPHLVKLPTVQHLRTRISGVLAPGRTALDVVAALHPTPAVGGYPQAAALAAIRDLEGLDRGWYAGPLGWIDAQGNGEFVVALRSGIIQGDTATLYAGCGIVAESDPAAEYAESQLKLRVMARALGDE